MTGKLWAVAILTCCAFFLPSRATAADVAPEAHEKAVQEFFKLTNFQESYERSVQAVIENHVRANPAVRRFQPVLNSFFDKYLGWKVIEPSLVKLYADTLTIEELRDLITFYSSPTGKKWSKAQTELAQKGAELQMKTLQLHVGELQQMLTDEVEKLRAQQESAPAAPEK